MLRVLPLNLRIAFTGWVACYFKDISVCFIVNLHGNGLLSGTSDINLGLGQRKSRDSRHHDSTSTNNCLEPLGLTLYIDIL